MDQKKKTYHIWVKRVFILLPYLFIFFYFGIYPIKDEEIFLPGGVNKIEDVVKIEGEIDSSGHYYSSYVRTITKPSIIVKWFSTTFLDGEVVTLSEVESELSVFELNNYSRQSKKNSVDTAIIVAYTAANKPINYEKTGVDVAFRYPGYPIFEVIRIGDRITNMGGVEVSSVDELLNLLWSYETCGPIELEIIRNGETKTLKTETVPESANQGTNCTLGISVMDHHTIHETTPRITKIDYDGYGGSAGLLQTLMIYDKLTQDDLTHGKKISGTGGINLRGEVTPIGGIKQKVLGAIKDGVDIYFAPNLETSEGNLYEVAKDVVESRGSKMVVVPVNHLDDALNYLNSMNE